MEEGVRSIGAEEQSTAGRQPQVHRESQREGVERELKAMLQDLGRLVLQQRDTPRFASQAAQVMAPTE